MGKQLVFEYDGRDYTLEYTRRSIEQMERRGFSIQEVVSKPMTNLPLLFQGAFIAHHNYVNQKTVDEIFSKMNNKTALLDKLLEMYQEPLNALMGEEKDEKNGIQWETDF